MVKRRTAEERKLPKIIYQLVTRTEMMPTPHAQELEDVVSVVKSFVIRYRRRSYQDYFTKDTETRQKIREELGMREDTIEEWLRCRTRALISYWLESEYIIHTEALEDVLDQVEDIWYNKKRGRD